MQLRLAVTAGAIFLLQGCPVYQLNRLPESSPLSQPVFVSTSSSMAFTRAPSQFVFPATVSGFSRVDVIQYDSAGLDVSAGYNGGSPPCPVVLTLYVSPSPRMSFVGADPAVVRSMEGSWLDAAFNRWKKEIVQGHPDAKLQVEDGKTQNGVPGKKAIYSIGSEESQLFVFVIEREWILTYRHTFPAQCAEQANAILDEFYSSWRWRDH